MAKTKYTIKAKLDLKDEDDFKYKTTLMIREHNEKAKEDVEKKDRDHIKTWCCLDQGHSELKCEFNKTVFQPNEVAEAECKIDNSDCKIDVTSVTMKVMMCGKITIDGHETEIEKPLPGAHDDCEGPKAGEKLEKTLKIDLDKIKYEAVKQKKNKKTGHKKDVSKEDQWMMSQIQPATRNAKHFKMRYYSVVSTKFDGTICCDETPDCETAMTIVPMVNPAAFGFRPPAGY
jgi:hypothetical protein